MTAATAGSPPRPGTGGDVALAAEGASDGALHPSSIRVTTEGSTVVIVVEGALDIHAGETLVKVATAAVDNGPDRLDIDLRSLQSYTEEGARALVACRALGNRLAEGLLYRTGRGPGREALLLAYQDIDVPEHPEALGDPR